MISSEGEETRREGCRGGPKVVGPAVTWLRDKTDRERERAWMVGVRSGKSGWASACLLGSEDCFPWPCPLCRYSAHRPGLGDAAKQKGVCARLATGSHEAKRGRGLVPISSVWCRVEAWRGPGGLGERGVWFIAHQCACFAVESRQLLGLIAVLLAQTALTVQRVAGYLST